MKRWENNEFTELVYPYKQQKTQPAKPSVKPPGPFSILARGRLISKAPSAEASASPKHSRTL
jgi:hypothetical protein